MKNGEMTVEDYKSSLKGRIIDTASDSEHGRIIYILVSE